MLDFRRIFRFLLSTIHFSLCFLIVPPSTAQDWRYRVKPKGTLKVVDLDQPAASLGQNYAEGLVTVDRDNRFAACLAEDWRWIDEHTVEFRLRGGVKFHNGEEFDAEAVRVNWEAYRKMESPRPYRFTML